MQYLFHRLAIVVLLTGALIVHGALAGSAQSQATASPVQGTGLPLPRFVSLKADRVHFRQGPGTEYKVLWVFQRAGLPVEVISEFEGWRQVRDSEGAVGWVLQALVSGRRTALVLPWEVKSGSTKAVQVPLRDDDSEDSKVVVVVEAGVLANVRSCDGRWCYVSIADFRGYIEQSKLWGVYQGEMIN